MSNPWVRFAFPETLLTDRLRGERPRPDHAADMYRLLTDPQVAARINPTGQPFTPEESQGVLDRQLAHWQAHGFSRWMIYDRHTNDLVGNGGVRMSLLEGEAVIELGYFLMPAFWGQGIATELARASVETSFRTLNATAVAAWALPTNQASCRVLQKAGMRYERDVLWAERPHALYRVRRGESR